MLHSMVVNKRPLSSYAGCLFASNNQQIAQWSKRSGGDTALWTICCNHFAHQGINTTDISWGKEIFIWIDCENCGSVWWNFYLPSGPGSYGKYTSAINPLTPNDDYSGHTTPLTSKCCILYIYSTNTGTEYFKHGIYSPYGFSGLGVAFWPLVPKFAGSNPAEAVRFLGRKNPQHAFLRRGSKAVGPML